MSFQYIFSIYSISDNTFNFKKSQIKKRKKLNLFKKWVKKFFDFENHLCKIQENSIDFPRLENLAIPLMDVIKLLALYTLKLYKCEKTKSSESTRREWKSIEGPSKLC